MSGEPEQGLNQVAFELAHAKQCFQGGRNARTRPVPLGNRITMAKDWLKYPSGIWLPVLQSALPEGGAR